MRTETIQPISRNILPLAIAIPTWSADGQRIGFHARDAGPVTTWTPRVLRSVVVVVHSALLIGVILFLAPAGILPLGALTVFGLFAGITVGLFLDQQGLA